METAILKRFAQQARRSLQDQVTSKLKFVLSAESAARREHPTAVQKLEEAIKKDGKPSVVDQVAYTWFNRFCALRFMDANRYNGANIVSPAEAGQYQPEILADAKLGHIDGKLVDEKVQLKVNRLLTGADPSRDPQAEAYRLLLVSVCNYWNGSMPFLFQRIDDYTELLLPDDLLSENSILTQTREALTEDVCQDVEVIGWLYQFYISEKKDEVMARKSAVATEDIPAVTQLFTPHWIVRYLVENSIGRLWMLNRPGSRLVQQMEYYIKPEEPETDYLRIDSVEDIKVCDPACGSGHMLTYAFDLLYAMYEEEGYAAPEIPKLILSKNLFGIEIDDRAGELAAFALTMKARAKDRRMFIRDVTPQITVLEDIHFDHAELADYRRHINESKFFTPDVLNLLDQFENAKTFGSLIQPVLSEQKIIALREALEAKEPVGDLYLRDTHLKVLRVLEQAEALTQRYHVVVANPPYMGSKGMNGAVKQYLGDYFSEYKSDLFAAFIVRALSVALPNGYLGFMSPFVWMFISSYEKLRERLISKTTITTLVQLEYSGFHGATVPVCTFTLKNSQNLSYRGGYIRLSDFRGSETQGPKTLEAISNPACGWFYKACAEDFRKIPGAPISFWTSPAIRNSFSTHSLLGEISAARQGLATTDNGQFCRFWHELEHKTIGFGFEDRAVAQVSSLRWFPFDKGGGFRKWYGNNLDVVNWQNDGDEIKANICRKYPYLNGNPDFVAKNPGFYFKPGITWGAITSSMLSVRWDDAGFIPSNAGMKIYHSDPSLLKALLGVLNSVVTRQIVSSLSETLNFDQGVIARIPFPSTHKHDVSVVDLAIELARTDWDNFETSWDFRDQPLLRPRLKEATLEASWRNWEAQSNAAIHRMQELETENNRLFIEAYGLEGELQPEVPEDQITLARAEVGKDMRDFISYAVGCMFGRYALEEPGLILANQGETLEDYLKRVPAPSFPADEDDVIPVLDGEWFTDDIVERFKQFLRVTFGNQSYAENLRFIEAALGTESKPKSLRDYFVKDFYNDHIKRYKKRPIYWMFTSPKGSFNALIYMHRYRPDTVSVVLNNYLREFRTKLVAHKAHLEAVSISAGSSHADKTKALKEIEKVSKAIVELEDYERDVLYPLATEKLAIDLDDGVKVNYLKFGSALKKIPGLEAKED
jgi:type II restriction/modification system DNA methylase subunit YeeA